jgi:hypothetical protein
MRSVFNMRHIFAIIAIGSFQASSVCKSYPIPRRGTYGCETSRLPYFLENRLTDGGEVVSLTRLPPFTPQKDSWYLFVLEAESTPGP